MAATFVYLPGLKSFVNLAHVIIADVNQITASNELQVYVTNGIRHYSLTGTDRELMEEALKKHTIPLT